MRVGFLVGSPKIGGAERQVWHLASGLHAAGHHPRVLFMERAGRRPAASCIDFSGIPHAYLGAGRGRGWLARRRLRDEAGRLDVIVAFNLDAMEMLAAALGSGTGVLKIGSVRGLGFTQDPRLCGRLREACGAVDLVCCNSPAILRALGEFGVHPADEVAVLPNVVPLPVPADPPVSRAARFLFVGNLLPVKEPVLFVAACLDAMERAPEIRATIVGDGPLRGAVDEATRARPEAFEVLGHVPPGEVPFAGADVVVSTSIREGGSNALLEAMASGRAVLATRAGGNVDLLEDSGAGLLVPVGDRAALAEAMLRLAGDADLRAALGARGREWVERHHARAEVTDRLLELAASAAVGRAHG